VTTKRQVTPKKIVFFSVFFVVLGISGIALLLWNQTAKENKGTILTNEFAAPTKISAPTTKKLETDFFRLTYPSTYQQSNSTSTKVGDGYQTVLLQPSEQGKIGVSQIGVTYRTLTTGTVSDDVTFRLYQAHPESYAFEKTSVTGETRVRKTGSDTYEQTVFIPHSGNVLILDISGDSGIKNLDDLTNSILQSIQWKK
jgi:hypothetical protein